jgi:SOS-response transcriptional repressor LexA
MRIKTINPKDFEEGEKTTREIVFDYIKSYIELHCYPPTTREVANGVGLKSSASAYQHIRNLIMVGLLETDAEAGANRALRIPHMKLVRV